MTVGLVDSTLREGSQAPVRYLSRVERLDLVADLGAIGVEELELGHAVAEVAYDPAPLAELLAAAVDLAPRARRAVWCRARPDDIEAAAALRPDVLSFALPVSDLHLTTRLRVDRAWALEQLACLVPLAHSAVGYVSVGLEDATRADPAFVDDVVVAAARAGADRVRLADTVGVAEPGEIARLVARVRALFPGEVGVHVHDDFGMATAGAVAALRAGAHWADVSLTGLGERAGISRTEEVAAWLAVRCGGSYDLPAARTAAARLSARVGRPVPGHAPVIGDDIFACESGLHLAGLVADPATYEPYPPDLVGARRSWRLGQGSGRAAVAALAPEIGGDLVAATALVRRAAEARGRAFDPAQAPMSGTSVRG
ncbi:hypothetical protein OEB99_05960 [Actinotalea sp. M2MS4P-6]|uniref:LeuA family protein n=1 Tax=Actinotalea sp. M2MS4P-6 TaxID=2983762 RepID=UPI0021E46290|nr:hypothetical protein [Actinotalea sp. M2MS4P-6]MCV2393847.1 hypothetical protein [Actinotalea sp. M2MS4P-6]